MNTREKLEHIADWLSYQEENLSFGLRTVVDAEKLFDYWQAHGGKLPEMADGDWYSPTGDHDDRFDLAPHRIAAVGYDPLASEVAQ